MATALFITTTDLKKNSILDGNVDTDKFIPYIKIAQDIHIQNYLGTELYNKISDDIINSTLTGDYLTLVTKYIQPMLIHWAMVSYLPFAAYQVKNGGVFKHTSENSQSVEKNEVDFLIQRERDIAEHYTRRFVDFMCSNSEKFPEYLDNTDEDMHPDRNTNSSNWVL